MEWIVYALFGVALAGAAPLFAKSGMRKSNVNLASAILGTVLFLGAVVMAKVTGSTIKLAELSGKTYLYLAITGIATGALWICVLRALQLCELIRVVPIIEGSIILDLIVGMLVFREAVTWNKIVIIILLLVGMVLMAIRTSGGGARRRARKGAGIGFAIAAMVLYVLVQNLTAFGVSGLNSYSERLAQYAIAMVMVWIMTLVTGGYRGLRDMSFLDGIYLCLAGIGMAAATYFFFKGYVHGKNDAVEMIRQFDLVLAVMLGCVFLRERTSLRAILGMVLMMAGFILLLLDIPAFLI